MADLSILKESALSKRKIDIEKLPYRPCAGALVIDKCGLVFIGRRIGGVEQANATRHWQLPQGGIDKGEDPAQAALRELYEETNIRSVRLLAEADDWFSYDIPRRNVGKAWKGKYRGQTQKWFAYRFEGDDSEIDIHHPAGGHKPEFAEWRWERLELLPDLIIPFKRPVYEKIVETFRHLI